MGTNYYWRGPVCPSCGRSEELHIGKSSAGWCFALHVYPEKGINTLEDWKKKFREIGSIIFDEYEQLIPPKELVEVITKRGWPTPADEPGDYSEPGPNNLYRHKMDGQFCIGRGEGTWDLCVGDFT